ncbi:heparan-sulfate 6-O-sulfotransferase 3-B [Coregonus clupeaformis]|uniref:heparan-sulfate 6-O-sulfotransferase 3-B n=1 Tax=Coregonus clupeaformis TaxID=59861 RepID=UPI001BE0F0A4|nr:heparan-sulfate 6-O-sulfotransferase 3-B [Coregonus clupeaformis]
MTISPPTMEDKSNKLILIPILAVVFLMIGYQYICPTGSNSCRFLTGEKLSGIFRQYHSGDDIYAYQEGLDEEGASKILSKLNLTDGDLERHVDFNIKGDDVIVFLHIQKTGGTTFGRHLVRNIHLEQPCDCMPGQKKCTCHRPGKAESWLFSRFTTGWSCGLHADWTELTNCVPAVMNKKDKKDAQRNRRNFYYITMLRDPVSRYLSEWKHVQRGATWKTALHMCDGRSPTQDELPACYSGDDWTGVTLTNFMDCPSNLANNRQVRMLADLSLVGCYNVSSFTAGAERERGRVLLASAKNNLRNMAFYGLTEFQRKTQYLFERTFGLRFIQAFTQINSTRAASVGVGEGALRRRIEGLNALDMELYEYAKELFLRRYQYSRQTQHREQRLRRRQERQEERERLHQHRAPISKSRREEEEREIEGEEVGGVATTEDYSSQVVRW